MILAARQWVFLALCCTDSKCICRRMLAAKGQEKEKEASSTTA